MAVVVLILIKAILMWILCMWRFQYLPHCCIRKPVKIYLVSCPYAKYSESLLLSQVFSPQKAGNCCFMGSIQKNLGYSIEKKWQQESLTTRLWKSWWQTQVTFRNRLSAFGFIRRTLTECFGLKQQIQFPQKQKSNVKTLHLPKKFKNFSLFS